MINLDTHILIHALTGNLRTKERQILSTRPWGISSIVLWEIAKLRQLGRVEMDLKATEFRTAMDAIHVFPISLDVARVSTELDFKGDPADEIIASTSIVYEVPLLTRDRMIRKSKLVEFL
jgi:PIN domain nuclease of toxin-antitoxin system